MLFNVFLGAVNLCFDVLFDSLLGFTDNLIDNQADFVKIYIRQFGKCQQGNQRKNIEKKMRFLLHKVVGILTSFGFNNKQPFVRVFLRHLLHGHSFPNHWRPPLK